MKNDLSTQSFTVEKGDIPLSSLSWDFLHSLCCVYKPFFSTNTRLILLHLFHTHAHALHKTLHCQNTFIQTMVLNAFVGCCSPPSHSPSPMNQNSHDGGMKQKGSSVYSWGFEAGWKEENLASTSSVIEE